MRGWCQRVSWELGNGSQRAGLCITFKERKSQNPAWVSPTGLVLVVSQQLSLFSLVHSWLEAQEQPLTLNKVGPRKPRTYSLTQGEIRLSFYQHTQGYVCGSWPPLPVST